MSETNLTADQIAAMSPTTKPARLAKLLYSEDDYTAILASKNPHTPSAALEQIALDRPDQYYLILGVALNSNTPTDTLIRLSTSDDFRIRQNLAYNKNTPAVALNNIITPALSSLHTPDYILIAVAANPNVDKDGMFRLLSNKDIDVRSAAYFSPLCPEELKDVAVFYGGVDYSFLND